jgi:hypothetical protein
MQKYSTEGSFVYLLGILDRGDIKRTIQNIMKSRTPVGLKGSLCGPKRESRKRLTVGRTVTYKRLTTLH